MGHFALTAVLLQPVARGQAIRYESGVNRVSLIELFTSEGCSSCPPADRWLGALRTAAGLWRDFVPVAFHVNYWDNLGWRDRLASRVFTERQYAHAAAWGSGSVYTPCFVRDGLEWHPGVGGPPADAAAAGDLVAELEGATVRVRWSPVSALAEGRFEVHAAMLGGGLAFPIAAGENAGATLVHEFAAVGLAERALAARPDGSHTAEFSLPAPSVTSAPRRAIAIWVTRRGAQVPLQATGGWLGP